MSFKKIDCNTEIQQQSHQMHLGSAARICNNDMPENTTKIRNKCAKIINDACFDSTAVLKMKDVNLISLAAPKDCSLLKMRGASANKYSVTCYPTTVNSDSTVVVNKQTIKPTRKSRGTCRGLRTAPLVETQSQTHV